MERDLNSMAQRKKRLLILGSGFGGLRLYTTIYKEYDTLLVDRKNYFEFAPQILSCFEKPERLKKIVIELDSNIRVGDFLHGSLVVVGNHSSLIQPWDIEKTTIRLNNRGWPFQVRYPNDPTQQNQTPVKSEGLAIVFFTTKGFRKPIPMRLFNCKPGDVLSGPNRRILSS